MRKLFCLAALCFTLVCACGCSVKDMGTLSDLTKPYAGLYECKTITLGGRELKEDFSKLLLELKSNGTYVFSYEGINGERNKQTGEYSASDREGKITFTPKEQKYPRTYSMQKGVIYINHIYGGKHLHAEFTMP